MKNDTDYLDMHCYRGDHNIAREIWEARDKAHAKHGQNSIEGIAYDDPRWLSILIEEVGELAHEMTYDSNGTIESKRAELIDIIAVASAWVDAIDSQRD